MKFYPCSGRLSGVVKRFWVIKSIGNVEVYGGSARDFKVSEAKLFSTSKSRATAPAPILKNRNHYREAMKVRECTPILPSITT